MNIKFFPRQKEKKKTQTASALFTDPFKQTHSQDLLSTDVQIITQGL